MRGRWYIPLLGLVLLLVGLWGYSQYNTRRLWENRTETQYQRAFSELTGNLGGLETQLAKCSISNDPSFLRQTLAEIWRLSYAAQEKLSQLPLTTMELTRMKMLLAKTAAFSYRVTGRPAESLRLTDAEWKTLQGFRSQSRFVSGQLTSMQSNILQNKLRWVDVDRLSGQQISAAAMAARIGTNKVTKNLVMLEDGLKRLPDPGFPESAVIYKPKPKGLKGAKITTAEGRAIASQFVGGPNSRLSAAFIGRIRGDIPNLLYAVTESKRRDAYPTRVSVTEQGGKVAWMLSERELGPRKLNLAKATSIAERFVKEKGQSDLTVVTREEFGGVDIITMAPKTDGVVRYPELVKVQVAMDSGRVVGYEGLGYLIYHDDAAKLGTPRLTAADAKKCVSPHLRVDGVRKAVTISPQQKEVLTYEVAGTMNGERFLVYIDANTGTEVKIRRVDANGVEID